VKRNYLLGIYTITPIVAIQAHRRAWWFREESRLNPLRSYSVEIIALLLFVLTLVEHSWKRAKVAYKLLLAKSINSKSSWLDEVREDTWTRSSSALRVCGKMFSTSARCFLSLFHNSHRGSLSALPLALAHINYGQLMKANMLAASRLTKSTLLRSSRNVTWPHTFSPGTTIIYAVSFMG